MGVQFSVEVGILLFTINQKVLLVVDFLSQGADHVDVDLNPGSIVVLHSALFISGPVECLLKIKKLILKILVLPLSSSEVHSLLSELGHKPVLVILS